MAGAPKVEAVRGKIDRFLREWGVPFSVDDGGDFEIPFQHTIAWVRAREWDDERTIVRVWSLTNADMRIDGDLTRFLVTTNASLIFGGFRLDEPARAVVFVHTLLGDYLNRNELEVAVKAVAATAELLAPQIKERFGGKLFTEP